MGHIQIEIVTFQRRQKRQGNGQDQKVVIRSIALLPSVGERI